VKCAVVTTRQPELVRALDELCAQLTRRLGPGAPDLVLAFYTPHHAGELDVLRRRVLDRLSPRVLLGCPGAGIIGGDDELESGPAIALWAARWPGAVLSPFALEADEVDGEIELKGWPESLPEGTGFLVLADPHSTPLDSLLEGFAQRFPGAPVVGGIASGAPGPGQALLLTADGVHDEGCLALAIGGGVRVHPVVSHGCRPVGRHFVITASQRNIIRTLGGRSALEQLQAVFQDAGARDQALMQKALHIGRVVDERKSSFERRDFLVRDVLDIDRDKGTLTLNDFIRPGQSVQFLVRDSETADQDMAAVVAEEARRGPALGALLFSCGARGKRFFGSSNHDIEGVHRGFPQLATAGFFAAGEIGPVAGQAFAHGFTASIALFREAGAPAG
jgi:small ligand-binding sensory domain FIST